jgi:hypothetical protein
VWRERTEEVSKVQLTPCANCRFHPFLSDAKLAVLLCQLLAAGKRGYYIVVARQVQLEWMKPEIFIGRRVRFTHGPRATSGYWYCSYTVWPGIDPSTNPR